MEGTKLVDGEVHGLLPVGFTRDVQVRKARCAATGLNLADDAVSFSLQDITDDHAGAFSCETAGNRLADAPCRTTNERYLAD